MSLPNSRVQLQLVKTFLAIVTANMVISIPIVCLFITDAVILDELVPLPVFYTIAFVTFHSKTLLHPSLQLYLLPTIRSDIQSKVVLQLTYLRMPGTWQRKLGMSIITQLTPLLICVLIY